MESWMLTGALVTKVTNCSCSLLGGSVPKRQDPGSQQGDTCFQVSLSPRHTGSPSCVFVPSPASLQTEDFVHNYPWTIDEPGPAGVAAGSARFLVPPVHNHTNTGYRNGSVSKELAAQM